jgi:galactosyl transferase GMA12/MNN10 family
VFFRSGNSKNHRKAMLNLKICFLQVTSPEIHEYSIYSTRLNKKYCELHNYDYLEVSQVPREGYDPVWGKIFEMINILKINKKNNKYTHIFYLDADAVVLNRSIKLESIISQMKTSIAFSANGKNGGKLINTGAFIATTEAIPILEKCVELSAEEMKDKKFDEWHEQDVINKIYNDGVEMDVFPMNEMNSYWMYDIHANDGQFIYHFMGRPLIEKVQIAKYVFENYNFSDS